MSINFPSLPASVTSQQVPVSDEVSLRVLRAGSGETLLFVPGWNFSAEVFVHQLTELAKHYDVIAIDPRGHGKSSKPLTGNHYAQRGDDLAELLETLDLHDIALAGWSFGVLDVLSYLSRHGSDRVSKLVLIDEPPRVPFDPKNPEEWGEAPLTHDGLPAFIQFISSDREGFLAYIAADALGLDPETSGDDPALLKLIADGAQTPEHIAIITGVEGLATDLAATAIEFNSSGKPLLFFAKQEWADDASRWVKAKLPGAEFSRIPVHAGFLTHPAEFNARLRVFLEGAQAPV